jgi:recombinational DNA repair ATPase RecF
MLEILIEGKLTLVFDNEFNETITKFPDGIEMPYDLLSNGQKRRINLALSQAFAYVRQLNVGNYPSIMFLDEISINMDSQGNQAIHHLITTHDQELQGLLTGFDSETIVVEMKDGFSKIAQK